jgi:signal transduction histidine kinase
VIRALTVTRGAGLLLRFEMTRMIHQAMKELMEATAQGSAGAKRTPAGVSRWRILASRVAGAVLLAVLAAPAAADPITLILLRILRDQLITRSLEAAWDQRAPSAVASVPTSLFTPAPASLFAPTHVENLNDQQIRQLIDDGFVHLSLAQRDEVYADVQRILSDPEHAVSRRAIVEELATKALAVRQSHDMLRQLSAAQKQLAAEQARTEYAKLPLEERQQIVQLLRTGTVPIPRDLSEAILAEFATVKTQ